MKKYQILLTTLNAKYIHSSLALAYLAECCYADSIDVTIREFSINENSGDIMTHIYLLKPDILCVSCYIWNIERVLDLCRDYKKIAPAVRIILGGPEVSYDCETLLQEQPAIDFIVRGEGEHTLSELVEALVNQSPLDGIEGIAYRSGNLVKSNPDRLLIDNLDTIPFPYARGLEGYRNRFLYYESCRGCPFNCAYCLSSTIKGVRSFSMERVKRDLEVLLGAQVREIKFVDRTFNWHESRAREIMDYIIQKNRGTRVHLEICADLLSAEMMDYLVSIPKGVFSFEIGLQSTCQDALRAVNRNQNLQRLFENVRRLREAGNIHLHIDLIAGLPGESYARFQTSFNDAYSLQAEELQLGFLKLLKGSKLREQASRYGYSYQDKPPYQVLCNSSIKPEETIQLALVEDVLDKFHNTGIMPYTLSFIIDKMFQGNAFLFYENLADFWYRQGLYGLGVSQERRYSFIKEYVAGAFSDYSEVINEMLKYDYLLQQRSFRLPPGIKTCTPAGKEVDLNNLLRDPGFVEHYLPDKIGLSVRELKKDLVLQYFQYNPEKGGELLKEPVPVLFIYEGESECSRTVYL